MLNQTTQRGGTLRMGGGLAAAFSLALMLLVIFVLPSTYSAVSGFEILLLGFIFFVGLIFFLVGTVADRRRKGRPL